MGCSRILHSCRWGTTESSAVPAWCVLLYTLTHSACGVRLLSEMVALPLWQAPCSSVSQFGPMVMLTSPTSIRHFSCAANPWREEWPHALQRSRQHQPIYMCLSCWSAGDLAQLRAVVWTRVAHDAPISGASGARDGYDALWSLRQKLDSPRQADRRLGQSNAQKRLFDRPGLSTFWRNDNTDAPLGSQNALTTPQVAPSIFSISFE